MKGFRRAGHIYHNISVYLGDIFYIDLQRIIYRGYGPGIIEYLFLVARSFKINKLITNLINIKDQIMNKNEEQKYSIAKQELEKLL